MSDMPNLRVAASGLILAFALGVAPTPLHAQGGRGGPPAGNPPTAPVPPAPGVPTGPIRVSSAVAGANIVRRVNPIYPQAAKEAGIQGAVIMTAIIADNGVIRSLVVTSGPDLLSQAALDAVSQWVYQPTLLNGQPVEVTTEITVNFTLR